MKKRFFRFCSSALLVFFSLLAVLSTSFGQVQPPVSIIPLPQKLTPQSGSFALTSTTRIFVESKDKDLRKIAQTLAADIHKFTGTAPKVLHKTPRKKDANYINLSLKPRVATLGADGYTLSVQPQRVLITAQKPQGIFYGLQSIRQLLPVQKTAAAVSLPALEIIDKPRYAWRGMHLDVSRHFFPVTFIKKYIDYIAMHKMNNFHWHLTDDQGWRIEIKKYPKLTEIGGYRNGTLIGHGGQQPFTYDNQRYGGFYTQEEVREVVKYAQDRFINVVPEIEMPGHAVAALTAYPELSCTGGPFEVVKRWGVFDDIFCAGNEQTFKFLEDVMTEVVALFPSQIVHVGGDEAPKTRWKVCPKCQGRIKAEGLKDEHELQSYFIQRMEKFMATKNRKIIGWDEILEGGLAPNAAVMSWRGMAGGIEAARQKHNVVMTPGSHVYFDHYQGDPSLEPLAFGGNSTLKHVYSFEPTPKELTPEEAKYIFGAQANVWTEYIKTPEHVEYMVLPRMASLSEVLWTQPNRKNWDDFNSRMPQQFARYAAMGANYAKSAFNVTYNYSIDAAKGLPVVTLQTESYNPQIYYTLDGSEPSPNSTKYSGPVTIPNSGVIKAATFEDGKIVGKVSSKAFIVHKAVGKPVTFTHQPNRYNITGPGTNPLVNSQRGASNQQNNGNWLAFRQNDLEAVIDLQEVTNLNRVSTGFLQNARASIMMPTEVQIMVSQDGSKFTPVKTIKPQTEAGKTGAFSEDIIVEIPNTKARYVKVLAKNVGQVQAPVPNRNADNPPVTASAAPTMQPAWIYVDEIVVE